MACANANCLDRSGSSQLYACFGPCGKLFHAKCVGSNNLLLDKINASNLAYWYCAECKQISLAHFSFKLSALKDELTKISKGFEDLSLNFIKVLSAVNNIPSPVLVSDKSCSTDDPTPQNPLISSIPKKSKKRGREIHTSSANVGPAPKKSLRSNAKSVTTEVGLDPETVIELIENCQKSSETTSVESSTELNNVITGNETVNSNIIAKTLTSVPRPKSIFVSRLSPETESKDLMEHLIASKAIKDYSSVKCSKISKPNGFVASFKIIAPSSLFEPILSCPWPPNTLVKEFTVPLKRKSNISSGSGSNSKNCKGSPFTTKM